MFQASAIIVGNMLESQKIVNLNPCIVVGWVKEANFHFVESKHVQCRSLTLNQLIPFLFFSFLCKWWWLWSCFLALIFQTHNVYGNIMVWFFEWFMLGAF